MRKLYLLITLLLCFLIPDSATAQFWVAAKAVPDSAFTLEQYKRHENGSVFTTIDGNRYAIMLGGRSGAGKVDSKRPVLYNYDTNKMTMGDNADDQYHHFQAAIWRDSIIVVGMSFDNGYPNEVPQTELWLYYIRSETWVLASTVPAARMRGSAQCVVYQDTAYFFNGLTDGHKSGWVNQVDKFDLVNSVWDTLAPSPRARDHAVALRDGSTVYLVGGRRSAVGFGGLHAFPVLEIDVYDILTDTWSTLPAAANLPSLRAGHQAVLTTNVAGSKQINIWGGEIGGDALISGIGLDLTFNTWSTLPDMIEKTHGSAIVPLNNDTLILVSGRDFGDEHLVSDSFYVQLYYGTPTLLPLSWEQTSIDRTAEGKLAFSWVVDAPADGEFEIQEMGASGTWKTIGRTGRQVGQSAYQWIWEESSAMNEGYYRIHLKMRDGTESYSSTLAVTKRYQLADVPSVITDQDRTVRFLYGQVSSASLYTLDGRVLMNVEAPYQMSIPADLSAGKYLLTVRSMSGAQENYQITVR